MPIPQITDEQFVAKLGKMPKKVRVLFNEMKYDECIPECEKILSKNPRSVLALTYLGVIYDDRKEYKKAISYFDQAAAELPQFFLVHYLNGFAHSEIDDFRGTKKSFLKYLEFNGSDGRVWSIVAQQENIETGRIRAMQVLGEAERRATKNKDRIHEARARILRRSDPDAALLAYLEAQKTTEEKTQKEKYSKNIYDLILKHIDPLKRTGINGLWKK